MRSTSANRRVVGFRHAGRGVAADGLRGGLRGDRFGLSGRVMDRAILLKAAKRSLYLDSWSVALEWDLPTSDSILLPAPAE